MNGEILQKNVMLTRLPHKRGSFFTGRKRGGMLIIINNRATQQTICLLRAVRDGAGDGGRRVCYNTYVNNRTLPAGICGRFEKKEAEIIMDRVISIFGNIVVFALAAGALIIVIELIWYRIRGRKKGLKEKKQVALITGASSGLGRALAVRLDRVLPEEYEFWLVARRKERLEELAGLLAHPVRALALDLTEPSSAGAVAELLKEENAGVGYLINCAGLGKIGRIREMPAKEQDGMIELNCRAAVDITDACLPFMAAGSHIVNICSTAGFQPFQSLNIYAASKAFFLRYTRALRMELLSAGIIVTAVCPYWIKDTEFIGIAGPEKKQDIRNFPLSSKVSSVASLSLLGARIGLPVVTPGIVCTFHRLFSKLFPDTVLGYIWEGLRRI